MGTTIIVALLKYYASWIKCRWWHNYQIDAFFLESPLKRVLCR